MDQRGEVNVAAKRNVKHKCVVNEHAQTYHALQPSGTQTELANPSTNGGFSKLGPPQIG